MDRQCIHCGKPGPFRDAQALKCTKCDRKTAVERSNYQRDYQQARAAALRILIDRHSDEYDSLLRRERLKIHRAARKEAS